MLFALATLAQGYNFYLLFFTSFYDRFLFGEILALFGLFLHAWGVLGYIVFKIMNWLDL